jgi:hypothetical protein
MTKDTFEKDLREAMIEAIPKAAKFANFCQAFKMEVWNRDVADVGGMNESQLDALAMIAFELLNK